MLKNGGTSEKIIFPKAFKTENTIQLTASSNFLSCQFDEKKNGVNTYYNFLLL